MVLRGLVVASLLIPIGFGPGGTIPASANDNGPGYFTSWEARWGDNENHTFCYDNLVYPSTNAMDNARINALDLETDMYDTTMSCNGSTDVKAQDGTYENGWRGYYRCWDLKFGDSRVCQHSTVQLNRRFLGSDLYQTAKTACHEVGHSIGLRHNESGGGTCMVSGSSELRRYNLHERRDHVNTWY